MFQTILVKVVTSLATSLLTFLGKWLINWIGTQQDNREIDDALNQEDRRRAASDLDIVFN